MTVWDEISEVVKDADRDFEQYVNDAEGNATAQDHHNHVVSYLAQWAQGFERQVREDAAKRIEAFKNVKKPYHYNAALTKAAELARDGAS